jgi:hypothetical protein
MGRIVSTTLLVAVLASPSLAAPPPDADPGPFVRALWLVQRHGKPGSYTPDTDQALKAALAKGLKDSVLTSQEMEKWVDQDTFKKLAGDDDRLDDAEIKKAIAADVPASQARLLPKVRSYADLLTTSLDMIDDRHRRAGAEFAEWIAANYQPGKPLHVTVICTGNSRRSFLGATTGNIAAAYCGMPEVQFHSGGTAPSACNKRTIAALKAIGVEVEPTGQEAPRGEPRTPNPCYRLAWGTPARSTEEPSLEVVEFSKHYADPTNPQKGFAALLVCSEADEACPTVKGAAVRVAMPYLDPKTYDDSPFEAVKYAERRDDIARLMMSVMIQVRNRRSSGPDASTHSSR